MIPKNLSRLMIYGISAVGVGYMMMNPAFPMFEESPLRQRILTQPSLKGENPWEGIDQTRITPQELENLARSRIVRVFPREDNFKTGGSGTLILRRGSRHYLLTSLHVVSGSKQFQIQTPDRKIYTAQVVATFASSTQADLALLRFQSSKSYPVIAIKTGLKNLVDQETLACGFPITDQFVQSQELSCNSGKIQGILKQPLVGGYQIGSTHLIKRGMSGGPILNQSGELVGINGLNQFPLFSNAYRFQDGRLASEEEISILKELSWAIPSETALELLREFSSQNPL